jgi:thioredoxin-dependent peroxiredoxin
MEAYRDQYATLFNSGKKVVVIGISVDPDTTQAAWARELGTPVLFASDPDQTVAKLYGAYRPNVKYDPRHLYVIGPDGRIAHKMVPFNELAADSYAQLGAAVKRASSTAAGGGN